MASIDFSQSNQAGIIGNGSTDNIIPSRLLNEESLEYERSYIHYDGWTSTSGDYRYAYIDIYGSYDYDSNKSYANSKVTGFYYFQADDVIYNEGSEEYEWVNDGTVTVNNIKGIKVKDFLNTSLRKFESKLLKKKDVITGSSLDDQIFSGKGNDQVRGGAGDDIIDGGKGNDRLWGGSGSDRFIKSKGKDIITDFNISEGDTLSGFYGNYVIKDKGYDTLVKGKGGTMILENIDHNELQMVAEDVFM